MINDIDSPEEYSRNSSGIVLPNNYHQIIEQLKIPNLSREGVDVFFGGPITYQNKHHWLRPIMYNGFNVHVLYLNCTPANIRNPHVTFLRTNDVAMKLSKSIFDEKTPRVFIRQSLAGSIIYPHVINPLQSRYMTIDDFMDIYDLLGLGAEEIDVDLSEPDIHLDETGSPDEVIFLHEKVQHFHEGESVMVADFAIPNDPWVHYQIITSGGINKLRPSKGRIIVRLDSGCDSGQIYNDDACECKEQLHAAVSSIIHDGGLVLHIPTQDGRGYGSGPKMETEGLKEGLPMKTNTGDIRPMDTVTAGKYLFGENYDIRTFDGAGKVLKKLGIITITLLTNNVRKLRGLRAANIDVETKDSQVIKPSCARHVIAKLSSGLYL